MPCAVPTIPTSHYMLIPLLVLAYLATWPVRWMWDEVTG